MTLKRLEKNIEEMFRIKREIGWNECAYNIRSDIRNSNYSQTISNALKIKINELQAEYDKLHKETLED